MLTELMLEELEAALKSHDWYYNYSDDHGSWQKGNIEEKTISRLMRELLDAGFGEEAAELYNSISPNCDTHRFTHGDKVTVVTVQEGAYHYEFLTEEEYESNGGDL